MSHFRLYTQLTHRKKWCVSIVEEVRDEEEGREIYFKHLDECITWCIHTLEPWKGVNRTSYDMWYFDRHEDAQKFITLFSLKWA